MSTTQLELHNLISKQSVECNVMFMHFKQSVEFRMVQNVDIYAELHAYSTFFRHHNILNN